MTFGQRLRTLLYEHDISQKQLALDLKLPLSTLNGYITDQREPDLMTVLQIANHFHLPTDYFLGNRQEDRIEYNEFSPTKQELRSFHYYRELTTDQKDLIHQMIRIMRKQNTR